MTLKEIFFADFLWMFKGLQGFPKYLYRGRRQPVFNGGRGQPVFNGGCGKPVSTGGHRERVERGREQAVSFIRKSKDGQSYTEEHSRLVLN